MAAEPLEQIALEHLVTNMLDADEEWLVQNNPTNYSYWQNRLETQLFSQLNEDGTVKLFAKTIIVQNIEDSKLAESVCASLNFLAVCWSFAYDYESKTIQALSSVNIYLPNSDEPPTRATVEPEPFQNAWLVIFTNTIWAQAAMSDELAAEIANKTNGKPAFSKPDHQPEIRQEPDAFNFLPDALRQRPEWVIDIRPYNTWPDLNQVANGVCVSIEDYSAGTLTATYESVDEGAVISMNLGEETVAYWSVIRTENITYGTCFTSIQTVSRQPGFGDFELANKLNLIMHERPESTQFGNWRFSNGRLTYNQLIPSAFIRPIEHSAGAPALMNYNAVFFERLALRSQGFAACFPELQAGEVSPETSDDQSNLIPLAREFVEVLEQPATPQIETLSDDPEEATSNPLILRRESLYNFFTIGIFNPIGPTILSLEGYNDEDGNLLLMENARHPLYPAYLPVAKVKPGSKEFMEALTSSIDRMFTHIPDYLEMSGCPVEIKPEVEALIKEKLHKLALEQKVDIAAELSRLQELNESPWQRVDHELAQIPESETPATKPQIDELFDYITSPENNGLFWNYIPDAWDGSTNFALSSGTIGMTDIGPFVLTYDKVLGSGND